MKHAILFHGYIYRQNPWLSKPRRRFPWRWLAAVAGVIALGWFVCCGVVTK